MAFSSTCRSTCLLAPPLSSRNSNVAEKRIPVSSTGSPYACLASSSPRRSRSWPGKHRRDQSLVQKSLLGSTVGNRSSFLSGQKDFHPARRAAFRTFKGYRLSKGPTANLEPLGGASGPLRLFQSTLAHEAAPVNAVPKLPASRHYENLLAKLAVSGSAAESQVCLAMQPVAQREIRNRGLENKPNAPLVNFGLASRDGHAWLPVFTRLKVPVDQMFIAEVKFRALAAEPWWFRRMRKVYNAGKEVPNDAIQEMVARKETRNVRIDGIEHAAVGFRPPGEWEWSQVAENFELWHKPVVGTETIFLQGGPAFLSLLCRSLATYSLWELVSQETKDAVRDDSEEVEKPGSGFLDAVKNLPRAFAAPSSSSDTNSATAPDDWCPSPSSPIRFRTVSPTLSAQIAALATTIESEALQQPSIQEAKRDIETVLKAKREAREWWPVPASAAEEIAALQWASRTGMLTEQAEASGEEFGSSNGTADLSSSLAGTSNEQSSGLTENGNGQPGTHGERYRVASNSADAASGSGHGAGSTDGTMSDEAAVIEALLKAEMRSGPSGGPESEEASTSGQEHSTDIRIDLVSPQDFHMHLMQVDGSLLAPVHVTDGYGTAWRIDKHGNRTALRDGFHEVSDDDVVELLLTHGQLVDLAEAVDVFIKDKATWASEDRPMLVKVPVRPEDTPGEVEKPSWVSRIPRLLLSGVLLVAFSTANKLSGPRRKIHQPQALSIAQHQSLEPRAASGGSPERKVLLPANSDIREAEMQLLCDAVATMAGFWTPADSRDGAATELVYQVVMSRDGEVVGCRPENSAAVEQWATLPLSKVLHRRPKKKLRHFLVESSVPYKAPQAGAAVIELSLLPNGEVRARPWPELPTGPPAALPSSSSVQQELLELRDSASEPNARDQGLGQGLDRRLLVSRSTTEVRASIREYLGLPGVSIEQQLTVFTGSEVVNGDEGLDGESMNGESGRTALMDDMEIGEWRLRDSGFRGRLEAERRALEEEFGLNLDMELDFDGLDTSSLEANIWDGLLRKKKGESVRKDERWREDIRAKAMQEASLESSEGPPIVELEEDEGDSRA